MALLNAQPDFAKRIKAVIHMDMVGGGPDTKAVFHVTRGPMSLPSFVHDVAWAFAEWVNEQTYNHAATGNAAYPLVSPEGGKEPLRAEYSAYTMGSDHDVYQDSSFGIPAIYLNDWPDRYIHTNFDTAANIDSTKLKRAAFIGAASGYWLAQRHEKEELENIGPWLWAGRSQTGIATGTRIMKLAGKEATNFSTYWSFYEKNSWRTLRKYVGDGCVVSEGPDCLDVALIAPLTPKPGKRGNVYERVPGDEFRRKADVRGPMAVFGYDYFESNRAKGGPASMPKLLAFEGLWGSGEEYAYEVLNFADGKRTVQEIRDAVSAEYGPVPLGLVVEYLQALEEIGVVEEVK
jgi:aminopeptidase YwaD